MSIFISFYVVNQYHKREPFQFFSSKNQHDQQFNKQKFNNNFKMLQNNVICE